MGPGGLVGVFGTRDPDCRSRFPWISPEALREAIHLVGPTGQSLGGRPGGGGVGAAAARLEVGFLVLPPSPGSVLFSAGLWNDCPQPLPDRLPGSLFGSPPALTGSHCRAGFHLAAIGSHCKAGFPPGADKSTCWPGFHPSFSEVEPSGVVGGPRADALGAPAFAEPAAGVGCLPACTHPEWGRSVPWSRRPFSALSKLQSRAVRAMVAVPRFASFAHPGSRASHTWASRAQGMSESRFQRGVPETLAG